MRAMVLFVGLAACIEGASWKDSLQEAARLRDAGQTAAAERIYQQTLNDSSDLSPGELNALGMEFFYLARYPAAESLYRRALDGWDRLGQNAVASRSATEANLGALLKAEGRFAEAETLLLNCLRQAEALDGPNSLKAGRTSTGLASLYLVWGNLPKAESYAVRAKTNLDALLTPQAPERTDAGRTLGAIWLTQRRYAEGEALLRSLLPGLTERQALSVYSDLAVSAIRQDHFPDALTLSLEALDRARRVLPAGHPMIATALNNVAQAERFQGNYLDAEKHYREAIAIWQEALGRKHPDTAKGLMNLAAFYHERGRESGAEELYRQAAAIFDAAYGPDQSLTLLTRSELAEVLRAEHRFSESEKIDQAILGPLEKSLGVEDPRVVRALANYARLLEQTKRGPQAAAIRGRIQVAGQGLRAQAQ